MSQSAELLKLAEIEEEIGVPLTVILDLIFENPDIYTICNQDILKINHYIVLTKNINQFKIKSLETSETKLLNFKDYNITWFLEEQKAKEVLDAHISLQEELDEYKELLKDINNIDICKLTIHGYDEYAHEHIIDTTNQTFIDSFKDFINKGGYKYAIR